MDFGFKDIKDHFKVLIMFKIKMFKIKMFKIKMFKIKMFKIKIDFLIL
jgi:hypothetical protein